MRYVQVMKDPPVLATRNPTFTVTLCSEHVLAKPNQNVTMELNDCVMAIPNQNITVTYKPDLTRPFPCHKCYLLSQGLSDCLKSQ